MTLTHTVAVDPGTAWIKDKTPAIDAPPDTETRPAADARWSADAPRRGVCGAVTPNVVPVGDGTFRMYYTQILPRDGQQAGANDYDNATTRILSALSTDGATWIPEPGVRLSPKAGGADGYRVVSPEVVPIPDDSGRLRMYYECSQGPMSLPATIRSAISEDGGLTWTMEAGERLGGTGSYCSPRVIFLGDERCRLYCGARGQGIVSALSTDGGSTFQLEAGVRIAPGSRFDTMTAFAPEVLRIAGAGYRMYYAGYSAPNRAHVLSAVSSDGLSWRKVTEPVLSPGGSLDGSKCSEMCVVPLAEGTRFRMFYEACDGTAPDERGVWRIASATSDPIEAIEFPDGSAEPHA